MTVTVIYDNRRRTTTIHEDNGRPAETLPEPDGLAGAQRTAELYAFLLGANVELEIR